MIKCICKSWIIFNFYFRSH